MTKVHFIHGLEGSPQGNKPRLLAKHFDTVTPAMDTSDFAGCVALHAAALSKDRPDVVVGSSFGGAVLTALIQGELWDGASLLLASASVRYGLPLSLPSSAPVWIVHGTQDAVIDIDDSRRLYAANKRPGVRLIEVDDDHPLRESSENGDLVAWVTALVEASKSGP